MSASTRNLLFGLPLVMFVALTLVFFLAIGSDSSLLPSARLDKPLPEFSLPSLQDENRQVTEAHLRGAPALLNVWATWCPTCRVEHSALNKLAGEGVPIYGLNYKDEREAALKYLANLGDPYRLSIFDEAGDLGLDLGVYGAPETYILDGEGYIRYRHVGEVNNKVWQEILQPKMLSLAATPGTVTTPEKKVVEKGNDD